VESVNARGLVTPFDSLFWVVLELADELRNMQAWFPLDRIEMSERGGIAACCAGA